MSELSGPSISSKDLGVENRSESIGNALGRSLRETYLGERLRGENVFCPEDQCLDAQKFLPKSPDDAIDHLYTTDVWEKSERIRQREFTRQEAQTILAFNQALQKHPDIVSGISSAILSFQGDRMQQLGVIDSNRKLNLSHVDQVRSFAASPVHGEPDPLTEIAAVSHDIVKYTSTHNNGETTQVMLLGMHETASTAFTPDVVATVLKDPVVRDQLQGSFDDYDSAIAVVSDFVGVIVANHGKDEFPDKQSRKDPLIDRDGVRTIFKGTQLYVDGYRPVAERFNGCSDDEVSQLNRMVEGLREADMMTGLSPDSFIKYHAGVKPADGFANASSYDYLLTFSTSVTEYLRDAPDTLGLREHVSDQIDQDFLLFALAREVQQPSFDRIAFFSALAGAAGDTSAAHIVRSLSEMKLVFDHARDKQEYFGAAYRVHFERFQEVITELKKLDKQQLQDSGLATFIEPVKREMMNAVKEKAPVSEI